MCSKKEIRLIFTNIVHDEAGHQRVKTLSIVSENGHMLVTKVAEESAKKIGKVTETKRDSEQ